MPKEKISVKMIRNHQNAGHFPGDEDPLRLFNAVGPCAQANLGCGIDHPFQAAAHLAVVEVNHHNFLVSRHLLRVRQGIEKGVKQHATEDRQQDGRIGENSLPLMFTGIPPAHAFAPDVGGQELNCLALKKQKSSGMMKSPRYASWGTVENGGAP